MRQTIQKHLYCANLYVRLLKHWAGMLFGKSYWHAQQGLGRQFIPGQLLGYYNDLTGKTNWAGPVDENGLPLNELISGTYIHFPTTLLQKALGHWDRWLESKQADDDERAAFLKIAEWALRSQDASGGWAIWPVLGLSYASPYSAMTQGEAVSVLVRAATLTQDVSYSEAARRAIGLMLTTVERGGHAGAHLKGWYWKKLRWSLITPCSTDGYLRCMGCMIICFWLKFVSKTQNGQKGLCGAVFKHFWLRCRSLAPVFGPTMIPPAILLRPFISSCILPS